MVHSHGVLLVELHLWWVVVGGGGGGGVVVVKGERGKSSEEGVWWL